MLRLTNIDYTTTKTGFSLFLRLRAGLQIMHCNGLTGLVFSSYATRPPGDPVYYGKYRIYNAFTLLQVPASICRAQELGTAVSYVTLGSPLMYSSTLSRAPFTLESMLHLRGVSWYLVEVKVMDYLLSLIVSHQF